MKPALTMADIGNAIEALHEAIEYTDQLLRSNLPPLKENFDQEDLDNQRQWSEQLKRFRKLHKKLIAIEKAV